MNIDDNKPNFIYCAKKALFNKTYSKAAFILSLFSCFSAFIYLALSLKIYSVLLLTIIFTICPTIINTIIVTGLCAKNINEKLTQYNDNISNIQNLKGIIKNGIKVFIMILIFWLFYFLIAFLILQSASYLYEHFNFETNSIILKLISYALIILLNLLFFTLYCNYCFNLKFKSFFEFKNALNIIKTKDFLKVFIIQGTTIAVGFLIVSYIEYLSQTIYMQKPIAPFSTNISVYKLWFIIKDFSLILEKGLITIIASYSNFILVDYIAQFIKKSK